MSKDCEKTDKPKQKLSPIEEILADVTSRKPMNGEVSMSDEGRKVDVYKKEVVEDNFGVIYSHDWKRLLNASALSKGSVSFRYYEIDERTEVICNDAFKDNSTINHVVLAPNVKKIGSGAFSGCSKIEEIVIPVGVTKILERTFEDCRSLKRVTLPQGLKEIGASAFAHTAFDDKTIFEIVKKYGKLPFMDMFAIMSLDYQE